MKKTGFQISALALLVFMGCSKDEPLNYTSENNQLKQGFWEGMKFESISRHDGIECPTQVYVNIGETDAVTELKILKNGSFFGSIQGKGKINQDLSYYNIDNLTQITNPVNPLNTNQKFSYQITATGKIFITAKDYCTVNITGVIITPAYYPPGWFSDHPDELYGVHLNGDGIITIIGGAGKLKDLNRTLKVYRSGNFYDCDLGIGQLLLKYFEH